MIQAIHVALPDADRQPATPQHRFDQLVERLMRGDSLLAELTAADLNISHLLPCDGAAVTLDGAVGSVGDSADRLALHLAEELQENPASEVYLTQQWRPVMPAQKDAVHYQSILAVRFNRAEAGWLFWFRKREAADWRPEPWSDSEICVAQRLRIELLEISLAQASQANRVQHRLIRKMAHDLSNPLQSISMSAALLKAEGKRNLDLRRHITGATEKLHELVAEVREVDRLCECASEIELAPTDLSELLQTGLAQVSDRGSDLQIETQSEPGLTAYIDPDRFRRLVDILVENAQRHRLPGSPLRVSALKSDDGVCLSISNQTQPLSAAQLRSLLHPTRRDIAEQPDCCQGIGLYLASAITRAHQGSLDVRQEDGWITFSLHLPGRIQRAN